MKTKDFLIDKFYAIFTTLLITLFLVVFLYWLDISNSIIFIIVLCIFTIVAIIFVIEYLRRYRFYNEIFDTLNLLDEKYLIFDMVEEKDFLDAKVMQELIRQGNISMNTKVNQYRLSQEKYQNYIELWVHEIKTPLAALKLMAENSSNKYSMHEVERVNYFVDQALYYARSSNVEKDYIIEKTDLNKSVINVIKQLKSNFIERDININVNINEVYVYSDSKWLEFIIKQILINSVQYSIKHGEIDINVVESNSNIKLIISDNGIGISDQDLVRIFEQGYTGKSGRIYNQATGMGLYLVYELSKALNIGVDAYVDDKTNFTLTIPKSSTYFKN